jgi:hypothetical protein
VGHRFPARLVVVDPLVALEQLGGYATRLGLMKQGVSRRALTAAVRDGRVLRVRHGVYAAGLPDGIDHLRVAVVALRGVVSHDSAAALWGLDLAHQPGQYVTVARNRSRAKHRGITVRRADVGETEVRRGVRVTTVLRTVLDCAAELTLAEAVVVADSALRDRYITLDELRTAAAQVRGKHAPKVRRVAALADDRSGSVLESLLRVLLVEAGLAPDECQWTLRDESGRFVARVDFAYLSARLIIEADGFEFHRARDDYRKDRRRANAYCRGDWSLLRFSWEDVRLDPDYVIDAVRHELAKEPRLVRGAAVPMSTQTAA